MFLFRLSPYSLDTVIESFDTSQLMVPKFFKFVERGRNRLCKSIIPWNQASIVLEKT